MMKHYTEAPYYSKDINGIYVNMNHSFVLCSAAEKPDDIIGLTDFDLSWAASAPVMMSNDSYVEKMEKNLTFFEHGMYMRKPQLYRSFKSPLLGRHGKVLGMMGISIPVSDSCLIPLSQQQTACLKGLATGLTHKQIGESLGLAAKTVEHYLDAVKIKLDCSSRSDLILQAIERGLVSPF